MNHHELLSHFFTTHLFRFVKDLALDMNSPVQVAHDLGPSVHPAPVQVAHDLEPSVHRAASPVPGSTGETSNIDDLMNEGAEYPIGATSFSAQAQAFARQIGAQLPTSYVPWTSLFLFDAGFGSVALILALGRLGVHCIACVKKAHRGFPLEFITATLKDAPSGIWITLEQTVQNIRMVALGYKYNRRKILYFVMTKGAGSTLPGSAYVAKFADSFGNVRSRLIGRPACLSRYFSKSAKIDNTNQLRQSVLALEKCWVTTDCWFRLFTTIVGMTVTDAYLALRSSVVATHHFAKLGLLDFVDQLLLPQLLDYSSSSGSRLPRIANQPRIVPAPSDIQDNTFFVTRIGTRIVTKFRRINSRRVSITENRPIQKRCKVCRKKTIWCCSHPSCNFKAICAPGKSDCSSLHARHSFDVSFRAQSVSTIDN